MNEEELKRMTDRPFTEKQFTALCFIRENYPGICCDADVALIWQIGGQNLVDDMMRRAVKCKKSGSDTRGNRNLARKVGFAAR